MRRYPERTCIPYYLVDAVVHAPFGSFPGEMPYLYARDEELVREWIESSKTAEESQTYLNKYVYGVRNHQDYLALIGDERLRRAQELREVRLMTETQDYSLTEMMICAAARLFRDETTCFIGTGIPMLAVSLAQRLHAPHTMPVFEFGAMGALLEDLPRAVGEARTFHKALSAAGICDVMETAQRGFIDYGFFLAWH